MTGLAYQGTRETSPPTTVHPSAPATGAVIAAVAGLVAGWIAAGSAGLLGHSYRRGLTWVVLGGVVLAALPRAGRVGRFVVAVLMALAAALPMIASDLRPANILGVVVLVVAVSQGHEGASKAVLRWSAEAVAVLALYRIANTSIPWLWLASDTVGTAMGHAAGRLTRQPLWIGATFAGLDFVVVMVFLALRATISRRPAVPGTWSGWVRCAVAIGSVALGQWIYLNALSCGPAIREHLPAASPPGTPWNPHPRPPGFEAAVKRWAYGDPAYQGEPAFYEPAVRLLLSGCFAVGQHVREWIPWNVPMLAAVIQALLAWLILRWLAAFPESSTAGESDRQRSFPQGKARPTVAALFGKARPTVAALFGRRWLLGPALIVAAALPAVVALSLHPASLKGKKIVLYEEGFLNWLKPKHGTSNFDYGHRSIGMYGMLPVFLRSLGATAVVSPTLSEADLDGAHVVVLIFPDKPWKQGQLERIRRFVERGGSLLVLGEHTILDADLLKLQDNELGTQLAALYEKLKPLEYKRSDAGRETVDEARRQEEELTRQFDEGEVLSRFQRASRQGPLNRFNEALAGTDMEVRFDSSTFAIGGWLQSYQPMSHPTSAGIGDNRNAFGSVVGASLELRWPRERRWPPSPLLIGLWGWGDPGNPLNYSSFMAKSADGSHEARYDAGERLGDVVLAAEQRVGAGRVVLFGDTSGFSNGVNLGAHEYTSRLFAYLADPVGSPQEPPRQAGGLLLVLALAVLLMVEGSGWGLASSAIVLGASLWACTAATQRAWEILPEGQVQPGAPNNLAYLDEAHLGHFSPESWREDGLMGLALNLMRNDYLCLMLPEFKRDRLLAAGADLGIDVAPVSFDVAKLLKIEPARGVAVTDVQRGKIAEHWGLRAHDVIVEVNGRTVRSAEQFWECVESTPAEEEIALRAVRGTEAPLRIPNPPPRENAPPAKVDLGITVEPVTEARARELIGAAGEGVVVTGIEGGKAGERAGLKLGTVILNVNGSPVTSATQLRERTQSVPAGQEIALGTRRREEMPLAIPNWTPRARLLVSVAPGREFSAAERKMVKDFVRAGGVFICTVGHPEAGPSRRLLQELGYYVGGRPWQWVDRGSSHAPIAHDKAGYGPANWDEPLGEPKPLGHFKSPYFSGNDYYAFVRFHAGWPIDCDDPNQLLITFYPPDVPVIVLRRYGLGLVTVVGDTAFAQNCNLENQNGSPFEGMRENAVFWRWLLAMLRDGLGEGERWFPQKSDTVPQSGKEASSPADESEDAAPESEPDSPEQTAPKKSEGKPAAAPAGAPPTGKK